MKAQLLKIGVGTLVLILFAVLIVSYYYWRTDPETVVVNSGEFPPGVSPGFTPDQLTRYVLAALQDIKASSESTTPNPQRSPTTLGLQIVSASTKTEPYTTGRVPFPIFDEKVKEINLNRLRQWGVDAKAKHFIWIDTISAGEKNFRLLAVFQDRPDFQPRHSWKVPVSEEPCQGPEKCTTELAEHILAFRDPEALVAFYMRKRNGSSFQRVVKLYESGRIAEHELTTNDYVAWGDALRGIQEYDQAINKYTAGLKLRPENCPLHDEIGFTYLLKYAKESRPESLDGAEKAYREAITCDPQDPVAHCNLGNSLIRKWKAGKNLDSELIKTAIKENERALEINPDLGEAAVNIGYATYMRGQRENALDHFREIARKFPTNSSLFLNFGYLLYREYIAGQGDLLQEAIDRTERAWTLDPKSYGAANNLGFMYFDADELGKAVSYWKQAHDLNSTDTDILAGLAVGLYKSGQTQEAVGYFREALRREPKLRNAEYLQTVHSWSKKAAESADPLIKAATPTS